MRHRVEFLLGQERRSIACLNPTTTVLEYLRSHEGRIGSKEGCAEGDCGACTVVLVREGEEGRLHFEAVNACILLIGNLDGKQLLTIEDLSDARGPLHPVQQAIVDANATQCGFCTPGIVMSMLAMYLNAVPGDDEDQVDMELAGNLCRCTGYRSIREACALMGSFPEDTRQTLLAHTRAKLAELRDGQSLNLFGNAENPQHFYFAPTTVDELAELCLAHEDATLLAGGTDVGLWVTKGHQVMEKLISVMSVRELREIEESKEALRIGAAVTYAELERHAQAHSPDLGELLRRIGSRQVRNLATLGGNIANGSPIGDGPPALIALGASLVLQRGTETREIPLEDFFLAYGQQDLRPGEFVKTIVLPHRPKDRLFACYKISKRPDQDITAVLGAFALTLEEGRIVEPRVVFGGMAGTPKRATFCEAALVGQLWTAETLERAMVALQDDYQPMSDHRASADYRQRVAGNLLRKFWIETTLPQQKTRVVGQRGQRHAG